MAKPLPHVANNDSFTGVSEESTGSFVFNVLANDSGKINPHKIVVAPFENDLLFGGRTGKSIFGADISVNKDGSITYTPTEESRTAFQGLGQGEVGFDFFWYVGKGGDTALVQVQITGQNDDPILFVDPTGSVTEGDGDPLVDTGSVFSFDPDTNDTGLITWSLVDLRVLGGGSVTGDQREALSDAFSADSDSWDYSLNSSDAAFLNDGQSIELDFAVSVSDGHGGLDSETVTITVVGSNLL